MSSKSLFKTTEILMGYEPLGVKVTEVLYCRRWSQDQLGFYLQGVDFFIFLVFDTQVKYSYFLILPMLAVAVAVVTALIARSSMLLLYTTSASRRSEVGTFLSITEHNIIIVIVTVLMTTIAAFAQQFTRVISARLRCSDGKPRRLRANGTPPDPPRPLVRSLSLWLARAHTPRAHTHAYAEVFLIDKTTHTAICEHACVRGCGYGRVRAKQTHLRTHALKHAATVCQLSTGPFAPRSVIPGQRVDEVRCARVQTYFLRCRSLIFHVSTRDERQRNPT